MKHFVALYEALDLTTSTNDKVHAMADYFQEASPEDAAWALFFLSGRRFKRFITAKTLKDWVLDALQLPEWLYEECYDAIGDTAETIALLWKSTHPKEGVSLEAVSILNEAIPTPPNPSIQSLESQGLAFWIETKLLPLKKLEPVAQKEEILGFYETLTPQEIFVLNKLLMGGFRVGVSQTLLVKALAKVSQAKGSPIDTPTLTHRLMGNWEPTPDFYQQLINPDTTETHHSLPYPFYLASPLDQEPEALGPLSEWLIEWKWDGIRCQIIKRKGEVFIWSRGEEIITDRFPEIATLAKTHLPEDTVLDGELLAFSDAKPLPFSALQKRIGRLKLTPKILETCPVVYMGFDLLEWEGQDQRQEEQHLRRSLLEKLLTSIPGFHISPLLSQSNWEEITALRQTARERGVEGFMLKRRTSPYQTGRKKGDWWKWKIEPYTIDAVMLYAQAGRGRRANLYTDYTFGVWDGDVLVPIAKAYSGLLDVEIKAVDGWIRQNTTQKFGPVRAVEP
ncbi:MAG: ATP-dependent DNA ligase, partial [Cyanobacteria bacterium]|nr:ATP-dependent DNA ligase [Cyanobacteriota bacterium]